VKTIFSKILNQNITIDQESETVETADGVKYTREELSKIKGMLPAEIVSIHKVKRHFQGVIM